MDAKKCDVCGRFYEKNNNNYGLYNHKEECLNGIMTIHICDEDVKDAYVELCDNCLAKLIKWITGSSTAIRQREYPKSKTPGRPRKPLPENFRKIYRQWKMGEISYEEASEKCEMSETTFRRKAGLLEEEIKRMKLMFILANETLSEKQKKECIYERSLIDDDKGEKCKRYIEQKIDEDTNL